jgi:hypothetical protein
VSNTYSYFVLGRVDNYYVIEPKTTARNKFVHENTGI